MFRRAMFTYCKGTKELLNIFSDIMTWNFLILVYLNTHWIKVPFQHWIILEFLCRNCITLISKMPILYNSKDSRIQNIVSKCASLHETYQPPLWCFGPWMNVLIMLVKEKIAPSIQLQREKIVCPDGGKKSLIYNFWWHHYTITCHDLLRDTKSLRGY